MLRPLEGAAVDRHRPLGTLLPGLRGASAAGATSRLCCARLLRGAAQERGAGEKSVIGARAAAAGIGIVSAVTGMPPGDAPPRRPRAARVRRRASSLSSSLSPHRPCRRGQVRRLRRGGGRGRAARRRAGHAGRVLLAARHVVPEDGAERLDLRRGRWPR